MGLTTAQEAMALAQSGRAEDGLTLLRDGQRDSEPEAYLLEGLWLLEGRFVPQDFAAARQNLSAAAALGHIGAARTFAGLLACGIGAEPDWQGAVCHLHHWSKHDPLAGRQAELIARMDLDAEGRPAAQPIARQLNADPRVERFDGLFTDDECKFLIELADPRMRRATIFHDAEQRFVEDPIRRSDKAGFPIVSEWPFVRAINQRIAAVTLTSVECGEPLQVLPYAATGC